MSKGDITVRPRSTRNMRRLEKLATATGKTVNQLLGELGDVFAQLPPKASVYYESIARVLENSGDRRDAP